MVAIWYRTSRTIHLDPPHDSATTRAPQGWCSGRSMLGSCALLCITVAHVTLHSQATSVPADLQGYGSAVSQPALADLLFYRFDGCAAPPKASQILTRSQRGKVGERHELTCVTRSWTPHRCTCTGRTCACAHPWMSCRPRWSGVYAPNRFHRLQ
jgi:hypothetical protein